MKKFLLLSTLLLSVAGLAHAQSQIRQRQASSSEITPSTNTESRNRTVGSSRVENHADGKKTAEQSNDKTKSPSSTSSDSDQNTPRWGNTSVLTRPTRKNPAVTTAPPSSEDRTAIASKLGQPTLVIPPPEAKLETTRTADSARSVGTSPTPIVPTGLYRVGIGDVLDVRLSNLPTKQSTLFTVLKDGSLEYPLLAAPVSVAGMTTDDIARLLTDQIKVIQARVSVSVRDYASHGVVITGLVDNPGRKSLRREAIPLYALLAEALPRPEASLATIVHAGKEQSVLLSNDQALSMLIFPDDLIRISGRSSATQRFVYIGGDVLSPGEREFRDGMTLTQALMSAGGLSRAGKVSVRVSRRNTGGFLTASEYNLPAIESGKSPDPLLEAGDRIEVTSSL